MAYYYQEKYTCLDCKEVGSAKTCSFCKSKNTRGSGRWGVRFRVDENFKKINKNLTWFQTKKDAENEKDKQLLVAKNSINIHNAKFNYYYDLYNKHILSRVADNSYKESSYYEFNYIFKNYILPHFENQEIKNITKRDILYWQNSLTAKNLSYNYKSKIRTYLFSFYRHLYKYYDIPNIVEKVDAFVKPKEKKEINFITKNQFDKYIKYFENDTTYYTLFNLLYYTGCRIGEATALKISDFDIEKENLSITKSIARKVLNKDYLVTTPKNVSSFRTIKLNKQLVAILKAYLSSLEEYTKDSFLFGVEKPLSTSTIGRKHREAIKSENLQPFRIHDFRHSHASLLINLDANVLLVAQRLGHSNIEMTLNTYSHLFPENEQKFIDKLNDII